MLCVRTMALLPFEFLRATGVHEMLDHQLCLAAMVLGLLTKAFSFR